MRDDLYEQLGVSHGADRQAIRDAYRRLAMRLHPDRTGGDAADVEHFRLITEAWHTLGDPARRAEYDKWLELHRRYDHLPEMERLPRHHARMSARNAARRSERRGSRVAGRRVRPFLLRRVSRVTLWHYLLMCALCLVCVLPGVLRAVRGINGQEREAEPRSGLPPGESPLSPEEQQRKLRCHVEGIRAAAEAGDAAKQYVYGNLLYYGVAGLGMKPDAEAAMGWWRRAARQGYKPARDAINTVPGGDGGR